MAAAPAAGRLRRLRGALLVLVALAAPLADAREPGPTYRAQAVELIEGLDDSVGDARRATIEHTFGGRNDREAAHAMRLAAERVESLETQALGLVPPTRLERGHAALVDALTHFSVALRGLESCYRFDSDAACDEAFIALREGEALRKVAGPWLRA